MVVHNSIYMKVLNYLYQVLCTEAHCARMLKFVVHLNAFCLQALKVFQSLFNLFIYKSMCMNCKSPLYIKREEKQFEKS